jgi:hypothetical protein
MQKALGLYVLLIARNGFLLEYLFLQYVGVIDD